MSKSKVPTINTESTDYRNLVDLLSVLSEATARQTSLEGQFRQEYLDTIDAHLAEYAQNQQAITDAEAAIALLAARNPGWFEKVKTIKTPFGSVKSTSSRKLDAPSPEASIRLIKLDGHTADYIRIVEELDLEALEKLTDDELAKYGIVRAPHETVKISPLAIDLGKAVAEATKKAA